MDVSSRYVTGAYLNANADWHVGDSPWKADQVCKALGDARPRSVCEIGCGVGEILRQLHDRFPEMALVGYDIAPDAIGLAATRATERLEFRLGGPEDCTGHFDLMLVMDVIEHVADPVAFLGRLQGKAEQLMIHIPLDLCALSVVRSGDLAAKRRDLGHVHYFTGETALATVVDAGYRVTQTLFTPTFELWGPSWKGRVARRVLTERTARRVLGGYSVLVSAEPA